VHVSAPASSANLGPGFDCLGLALDLPFELVTATDVPAGSAGFLDLEPTHPASIAFVAAGGDPGAGLRWRSPIPPGRGLGFSGAARVAGGYLAALLDGLDEHSARSGSFRVAAELEGHPDNAAASAHGGFTVAAAGHVVSLPLPDGFSVLVWSPEAETSTDASRRVLPERVDFDDAVFSTGRAALWVAAVASGRPDALRAACQDRLHQPGRLAARPDAARVLEHLLGLDGVSAAWLSGSGPTVAALVEAGPVPGTEPHALPLAGSVRVLQPTAAGVQRVEA
jgi:homoserine kinase